MEINIGLNNSIIAYQDKLQKGFGIVKVTKFDGEYYHHQIRDLVMK